VDYGLRHGLRNRPVYKIALGSYGNLSGPTTSWWSSMPNVVVQMTFAGVVHLMSSGRLPTTQREGFLLSRQVVQQQWSWINTQVQSSVTTFQTHFTENLFMAYTNNPFLSIPKPQVTAFTTILVGSFFCILLPINIQSLTNQL